jgi:hypothetical protein
MGWRVVVKAGTAQPAGTDLHNIIEYFALAGGSKGHEGEHYTIDSRNL